MFSLFVLLISFSLQAIEQYTIIKNTDYSSLFRDQYVINGNNHDMGTIVYRNIPSVKEYSTGVLAFFEPGVHQEWDTINQNMIQGYDLAGLNGCWACKSMISSVQSDDEIILTDEELFSTQDAVCSWIGRTKKSSHNPLMPEGYVSTDTSSYIVIKSKEGNKIAWVEQVAANEWHLFIDNEAATQDEPSLINPMVLAFLTVARDKNIFLYAPNYKDCNTICAMRDVSIKTIVAATVCAGIVFSMIVLGALIGMKLQRPTHYTEI